MSMSEIDKLFGGATTPVLPTTVAPMPVDTAKVNAFQVVMSPIVISGVEGRVTKETGPFMVVEEEQLKTMVYLVSTGVLRTVNVDRKDVKMLGYGSKIQPKNSAIQFVSQGMLIDKSDKD